MNRKISIGVDVGGSHISSVAYEPDEKKILSHTFSESKVDNKESADEIISTWAKVIAETIDKVGPCQLSGIGFAMPGPFDYVNGIALFQQMTNKYEKLFGVHVGLEISKALGFSDNVPVRFINDAAAFAIGESIAGGAAGFNRCLAITLGTGFGSSFILNHVPVVSGDTVPLGGMVYHLPFEKGVADDYFSTRGLLNRYFEKTGVRLSGVKELAEKAPQDALAEEIFCDFGTKLGIFLHPWVRKFNVETLVIGGNIAKSFHLFGESLTKVYTYCGINLSIQLSVLNETASMIGAAKLSDDDYYNSIKSILNS
jgi:glucokinase